MNENEGKKCQKCKMWIPKDAKVCPYCREDQTNFWTIFVMVAFGIIFFFFLLSNDSDVGSDSATSVSLENYEEMPEEDSYFLEKSDSSFTSDKEFTYRDMTVKYLKHEIVVDDMNQTVLVIYYDFTNNSDENKTFVYSFEDTCFQNGVEVESSWWHVNDESKNTEKEIKPGTTITVASSFVLEESRDDIELEITPWIGDKILFEKNLVLE